MNNEEHKREEENGDNGSWFNGLTPTWWVVGIIAILVIFFIIWVWN